MAKRIGLLAGILVAMSIAVYVAGNAGTWLGPSVAPPLITHDTATYRSQKGVERNLTRDAGLPSVQGCA